MLICIQFLLVLLSHILYDISAVCPEVVNDLQQCEVPSMSPSRVCIQCMADYNTVHATWLSYLTCVKPDEHYRLTVNTVVDSDRLVSVRSASHLEHVDVSAVKGCEYVPKCRRKDKCKFAHSDVELDYWRSERAKEIFCSRITELVGLIVCRLCIYWYMHFVMGSFYVCFALVNETW